MSNNTNYENEVELVHCEKKDSDITNLVTQNHKIAIMSSKQLINKYYAEYDKRSILQRIFIFMEDANKTIKSRIFSICIMITIILSVITFVVQSDPYYRKLEDLGSEEPIFFIIETVCIVIFTFEYLMRVITFSFNPIYYVFPTFWDEMSFEDRLTILNKKMPFYLKLFKFITNFLNLIDLVAILPYYIQIIVGSGSSPLLLMRVLRLGRIIRLFKVAKYYDGMQILGRVLRASASSLLMLVFFVTIAMMVFGALIYFAEMGTYINGEYIRYSHYGDPSITPYHSIAASFWWVVVTITTVGYGDVFPVTIAGKIIAFFCMLLGILVLAMPIIGSNFSAEYQKFVEEKKEMEFENNENDGDENDEIIQLDGIDIQKPEPIISMGMGLIGAPIVHNRERESSHTSEMYSQFFHQLANAINTLHTEIIQLNHKIEILTFKKSPRKSFISPRSDSESPKLTLPEDIRRSNSLQ